MTSARTTAPTPPTPLPKPLLLGHRGSPRQHRENTLEGFRAALAAGLHGVELDVQQLADGTLAVHHDPDLPPEAGGHALHTLTHAELPGYVPTLPQVLAWAAEAGAYVNVEIKVAPRVTDNRAARTVQAIEAAGLGAETVMVSSFDAPTLQAVRGVAPGLPTAYLYDPRQQGNTEAIAQAVTLGCAALHPYFAAVDAEALAAAHAAGLRVNAWTVNDAAEVARLRGLGVDGLIGDLPATLLNF